MEHNEVVINDDQGINQGIDNNATKTPIDAI